MDWGENDLKESPNLISPLKGEKKLWKFLQRSFFFLIVKITLNKTPNTPLPPPHQNKKTNKKSILHLYELLPMCIKEEKNKGENFFSWVSSLWISISPKSFLLLLLLLLFFLVHRYNTNILHLQYKCSKIMIKYNFENLNFLMKLGNCGLV